MKIKFIIEREYDSPDTATHYYFGDDTNVPYWYKSMSLQAWDQSSSPMDYCWVQWSDINNGWGFFSYAKPPFIQPIPSVVSK